MSDKYKKTAIGFRRLDNQPLEDNVYFRSFSAAGPYMSDDPTVYNGQRFFVHNSLTGRYDEYQIVNRTHIQMNHRICYTNGLFGLNSSSTSAQFSGCFNNSMNGKIETPRELYNLLVSSRQIVDSHNGICLSSTSLLVSGSDMAECLVDFISGGRLYTCDLIFDMFSTGLSLAYFNKSSIKLG